MVAMQLHVLFLLICLAFCGTSSEQEDYWKMKLPKVPMPQAIKDNLLHSNGKEKVTKAFEQFTKDTKKKASSNKPYNYLWDWSYYDAKNNPKNKINLNPPYIYLRDWSYDIKNAQKKKIKLNPPYINLWDWSYNAKNAQKEASLNQPYNNLVNYWRYNNNGQDKAKVTMKTNDIVNSNGALNHNKGDLTSSGSLFFVEESLNVGMKLKHDFQKSLKQIHFLPKQTVQSLPFSVDKFSEILTLFSVEFESAEAYAIQDTLNVCLSKPKVKKENRTCAQSMEDIVDFVIEELGTNDIDLKMMKSNIDVPNGIHDYVITKVKKLVVPKITGVACHRVSYPYIVYYCHHQQDIGHYDVTLVSPTSGTAIRTTAVCHYDTYAWDPNSPALRHHGIRPGEATLCHFSTLDDMFWTLNVDSKLLNMAQ